MNFGTRRSDEVLAELGFLVVAGLGEWVGGVGAAVLAVELWEAVGVCVVDAVEGPVAPPQPAKTDASAVVLARDRRAYRRGCLTWTNSTSRPAQGIGVRHNGVVHDRRHTGNKVGILSDASHGTL